MMPAQHPRRRLVDNIAGLDRRRERPAVNWPMGVALWIVVPVAGLVVSGFLIGCLLRALGVAR